MKQYEEITKATVTTNKNMKEELTCDLRDLGIQMIALPSREQVTILSWLNLKCKKFIGKSH